MAEVPRQNTPASIEEISRLLGDVAGLNQRQRCFLLAHIRIENDNGRAFQNHNVGNLIVSRAQQSGAIPFWRPPWFTVDESSSARELALHQLMLEGKEPSAFRAFGSLEEGLRAYVKRLRERFPTMLRASSPRAFVEAWKSSGYAPNIRIAPTLRNFESILRECDFPRSSSSGLLWLALAGGAAWLIWRKRRHGA